MGKPINLRKGSQIPLGVRGSLSNAQAQMTALPRINRLGSRRQKGRKSDLAFRSTQRGLALTDYDDHGNPREQVISRGASDITGVQTGTAPPTIVDNFPTENEFGWYLDTNSGYNYFSLNYQGTLKNITLNTLEGELTNDLHGDLGRRTTAGNPHHTNATDTQPGFMSIAHFTLLDEATDAADPDTLAMRDGSGGIAFTTIDGTAITCTTVDAVTSYSVGGTKVVGAQGAAITPVSGTAAVTYDAATRTLINDNTTAINLILARLAAATGHGLIA